ncbi:hypothetical protein CH337_20785 [Rhodoblastus acidophilus]|nr:hypothetical protein CKO16_22060 [Rhodoblastus acidophilus]RAI16538.1 hypothetical protein CH337_20785 [Rhodoblastus acidophilus]
MSAIEHLLHVVDRYGDALGLSDATVSTRVFNDGKRVATLRRGGDIGVRSFENALTWFSDHWPADASWPADVPRPTPTNSEAAA